MLSININMNKINMTCLCLTLMVTTACKSVKYVPNQTAVPATFQQDNGAIESDSSSIATLSYKEFFSDQILLDLIDTALLNNNNLQVAIKQIDIATESMKQAKWGYLPQIGFSVGTGTVTRPSDNSMNGMMAGQFMGKKYMEDYTTAVNISWEADIWGKIKGRKEMALSSYLQTQEASKAIQTRLVSTIAQGYYNLLMLDLQKDISLKNLSLIDNILQMTRVQHALGLTTLLAVQQQEGNRDLVLKSIPVLDEQIIIQENTLQALVGRMPGHIERKTSLLTLQTKDHLATGVPAMMLALRPDVRTAELEVQKSFAQVHVAKVSMYPSLNITAQGGLNAFKASDWFNIPGSLFGALTGSLTQPILQGRQLKTAFNQSKIASAQAEIQFKESVLQAVGEVSNILASMASLKEQEEISRGLVARNQEMIRNADILFKNDMATYLEVIAAQQSKLQAELDNAAIKSQRLYTEVNLYRALGGGRH